MWGGHQSEGVVWLGILLGIAWTSACGSPASSSRSAASSLLDATVSAGDGGQAVDHTAPVSDGSPSGCPACTDAAASDQGTSGQDADAGPASGDGICHVTWPQSRYDYYFDGTDMQRADFYLEVSPLQMAVDSAGDAYLAITYSTQDFNPAITLDIGVVASPAYQVGVAVAKVDANCNLLWVREIGGALTVNVSSTAIALDANSNVTVLGAFQGTVDVGGTMLSAPSSELYLVRFDPSGNVVFAEIVPSDGSQAVDTGSLVVGPGGISTIMAGTWIGLDAGAPQWVQYFVQTDARGTVVSQSPTSATGPFVNQMAADSSGTLWGLGVAALDAGLPSSGPPIVMELTSTGGIAWSRPTPSDSLDSPLFAAGPSGAVVFAASYGASSPYGNGTSATETLQAYSPDGTSPWTQATEVSYAQLAFDQQMVVDVNGNPIVAGDFMGSVETSADGSTTTAPTPSGIGVQAFDSTGHFVSLHTWIVGGSDKEHFHALAVDAQGNVLLAGTTESTGSTTGTTSVFLVKLAR
jgi:hypothetical protein